MGEKMKNKLGFKFWTALTIFSLMGQVAWVVENMYFNVFIFKIFSASAADIAAMVAASAVSATLTTVFIGALSDKIGKRKLFISLGYILWGVSIFCFCFLRPEWLAKISPAGNGIALGITLTIILDCVMTFFGSTANDAAFNAWLTDSTDSTNRGAAEGINSMMPLVAILVVFGGFMFFDLEKISSWTLIFAIIGALVVIIGILGIFLIKEPPIAPSRDSYFKTIIYGFRPRTIRANKELYISLLLFILFNIAIQIFMPYLIIYYEVALGMKDYVLIMAPAIVIASVVTALWGRVYDKKGFKFSGLFALAFLILGFIALYLFKSTLPVFIGSLLMMSGYLAGMAVFGARIRDNTPSGKAGMLQGVRIFSQVLIPGLIGPFIGKTVLQNAKIIINSDGTESFVPNENIFLAALLCALPVLIFFLFIGGKKPRLVALKTPYEENMGDIPHSEYPRPSFKRASYLNLNGEWGLQITDKKDNELFRGKIMVPFPPESRLSGVERETKKGEILNYTKKFTLPEDFRKDKVILHFGAVDQVCGAFINGIGLGLKDEPYLPISFDITEHLKSGENEIKLQVFDELDMNYPYGKQKRNRGGMWYTPVSGIWGTVWLESLPQNAIEGIKITPDLKGVDIEVSGGEEQKTLILKGEEEKIYEFSGNSLRLEIENPELWTPETPKLYEFELISGEDRIESYFALRTIGIENGRLTLNGKPYFFHGLLDQGYFSDGIYLPASLEGYKNDVLRMKECGFNTLRKHIKLEPELFYYYCDKLGMIVFQDMINSGKYSFFIDTALPTIGLKKGVRHKATKARRDIFYKTSERIIELLYNHPSVVYYTIFNEGWGQFSGDEAYKKLKDLDKTRIFDSTSGWFKETLTDVESEHIYFKPVKLKKSEKPIVLSEFGGYSQKVEDHSFNLDKTYGYRFFQNAEDFEAALIKLYEGEIIPNLGNGLCASILTQVSDVEDETNGLLTYDRAILKVDSEKLQALGESIKAEYNKITQ